LGTGARWVVEEAAAARVHRDDKLKARRVGYVNIRPRHRHPAGFQRLTQRFKHLPGELRQLVQEEHTIVCQTDLTGFGFGASS